MEITLSYRRKKSRETLQGFGPACNLSHSLQGQYDPDKLVQAEQCIPQSFPMIGQLVVHQKRTRQRADPEKYIAAESDGKAVKIIPPAVSSVIWTNCSVRVRSSASIAAK